MRLKLKIPMPARPAARASAASTGERAWRIARRLLDLRFLTDPRAGELSLLLITVTMTALVIVNGDFREDLADLFDLFEDLEELALVLYAAMVVTFYPFNFIARRLSPGWMPWLTAASLVLVSAAAHVVGLSIVAVNLGRIVFFKRYTHLLFFVLMLVNVLQMLFFLYNLLGKRTVVDRRENIDATLPGPAAVILSVAGLLAVLYWLQGRLEQHWAISYGLCYSYAFLLVPYLSRLASREEPRRIVLTPPPAHPGRRGRHSGASRW